MTKLDAYNELNDKNVHWNRVNDKTIIVYMSSDGNGSHHANLDAVTSFLANAGFYEFERDFDLVCGKGYSVYKETNKGEK
jgi:hypothetical protein